MGRGGGGFGDNLSLTNCTVSGNSVLGYASVAAHTGDGGGLYGGGVSSVTDCTVSGNSAFGTGGGLQVGYGYIAIANTIVAGNTAGTGPDVNGGITSQGNNLIGKTDGSSGWVGSDLTGTEATPLDALLAPLGNYGGPTQTMALLPGSPAIDAGNNALIPAGVTTDQRGLSRIVNGTVDIGAFESSGFAVTYTSGSGQTASGVFLAPLVVTVTAINPIEPVEGVRSHSPRWGAERRRN